MSSISPTDPTAYLFTQPVAADPQAPQNTTPTADTTTTADTTGAPAADTTNDEAASTSGHRRGYLALFQKLAEAIGNALQAASSDTASDPNQVIEQTIVQFMKDNGIVPPSRGALRKAVANRLDEKGVDDAAHHRGRAVKQAYQDFMQMLQSYGVDGQQFHQDFLAALKEARQGNVDPATAMQSFPPGTTVDATT